MKRRDEIFRLLGFSALVGMVGCSGDFSDSQYPQRLYALTHASKSIKAEDLGNVPGGLIDPKSELLPLLGDIAQTFDGSMERDSTVVVDVAANKLCAIKAGTSVALVAKNGDYLRVLGEANCGGEIRLVEGFVPLADVKDALPSQATMNTTSQSASVMVATQAKTASAPAPAAAPAVAAGPTYSGCTQIIFEVMGHDCKNQSKERPFIGCLVPGEWFRKAQDKLQLIVKGNAARWQVRIEGQTHTVDAPKYKEGEDTYLLPIKDVLDKNNSRAETFEWEVSGLDASNNTVGKKCSYQGRLMSPLVLDLENVGKFDGLGAAESRVKFDLAGEGTRVQTGWVNPSMGFLAMDKNGNGRIDDGTELFGEATRLSNGKISKNGYTALADLDENNDGVVSSADSRFGSLLVWLDSNGNGVTENGELRSLASLQIEKLGVAYSPSVRHGNPKMFENDVRYEARYWGPARCGIEGCLSFDVYFSTIKRAASVAINK
jgi:hypothetical protein